MLLDLIEVAIDIYTSLGYGTKEQKIESKMEQIKCDHPQTYEIYVQNKVLFETDPALSKKILDLNVKNKTAIHNAVKEIYAHFTVTANQSCSR